MFAENTCCPCQVPLWAGVLVIGLAEFGMGMDFSMLGFEYGGLLMFNSIWFALLFVPSLFYNQSYRKAVLIVFAITTIINILMGLMLLISGLMAGRDLGQALSDYMEYGYDCAGEWEDYGRVLEREKWAVWEYQNRDEPDEDDNDEVEEQEEPDCGDDCPPPPPTCDNIDGSDLCDLQEYFAEYESEETRQFYYAAAMQGANPEMQYGGDRKGWRWVYDYYLQSMSWGTWRDNIYKCGDGIDGEIPEDEVKYWCSKANQGNMSAGALGDTAWKCGHLTMIYWLLTLEWWISAILIRAFFTVVVMKFQKEPIGAKESHPCQPLCCSKA